MKRNAQAGVTQLELMVSLALMALIAVFLANLMTFSQRNIERSIANAEQLGEFVAQRDLKRWITMIPVDYEGQDATAFFLGNTDSLIFKTNAVEDQKADTLTEFSLNLQLEDNLRPLILKQTERVETKSNTVGQHVLAQNVTAFEISYFGRISDETEKRWHSAWKDEKFLPDLVKIEWETTDGAFPPITALPARIERQRFMSRSSLLPPG